MLNPDLNDPVWIAGREEQWNRFCDSVSDEYSMKELAYIKPMFFEKEFDFGNKAKYGMYAEDCHRAFILCPVQTEERWREWFAKKLPEWMGKDYQNNLRNLLFSYGYFTLADFWPTSLSVKLFEFCFGKMATLKPYTFLGFEVPSHPLIGSRSITFCDRWLSNIYLWLTLSNEENENYCAELIDMWFSLLPFVHPIYFRYDINQDTSIPQKKLQDILYVCSREDVEGYFHGLVFKKREIGNKGLNDNDQFEKRILFVREMRARLNGKMIPEALQQLWGNASKPNFVPAHRLKKMPEVPKIDRVRKHEIGKWAKKRAEVLAEM